MICTALRLTVDDVIVYIAARFGSTDAKEFTLQQQNVKTKAATKYAVKVLSDFMLEKNYDGEMGTMDIVVLNGILQDFYANVRTTTTLSAIDFLDIDDNLLLETLMQIEKQPLQTQSNNQFIQHENVMSNNTPSFNFNNNCTVTINYAGKQLFSLNILKQFVFIYLLS